MDEIITSMFTSFITTMATKGADAPAKTLNAAWEYVFGPMNSFLIKHNSKRKQKLESYLKSIQKETEKISPINLQEPQLNILGPALEASKYYIDEKELRDMFAKLVAASFDKTKNEDIHPVYVEIIKQLNAKEALILKTTDILIAHLGICDIRWQEKSAYRITDIKLHSDNIIRYNNNGYDLLRNYLPLNNININYVELSTMIDNWIRLNLIEVKDAYLMRDNAYRKFYYDDFTKKLEQQELSRTNKKNYEIAHTIKTMYPTYLGKNFYKICIKD